MVRFRPDSDSAQRRSRQARRNAAAEERHDLRGGKTSFCPMAVITSPGQAFAIEMSLPFNAVFRANGYGLRRRGRPGLAVNREACRLCREWGALARRSDSRGGGPVCEIAATKNRAETGRPVAAGTSLGRDDDTGE